MQAQHSYERLIPVMKAHRSAPMVLSQNMRRQDSAYLQFTVGVFLNTDGRRLNSAISPYVIDS